MYLRQGSAVAFELLCCSAQCRVQPASLSTCIRVDASVKRKDYCTVVVVDTIRNLNIVQQSNDRTRGHKERKLEFSAPELRVALLIKVPSRVSVC